MEEREQVVQSLPAEVTWDEMAMPEGDLHYDGKRQALDALRGYFKQQRRRVYVGAELPIYYPGERRFAPDLLVVLVANESTVYQLLREQGLLPSTACPATVGLSPLPSTHRGPTAPSGPHGSGPPRAVPAWLAPEQ